MKIIENIYDILNISNTATDREIKTAYVKMLRRYPPEKAPEEFKKIREAYEKLIDPISRAKYDAFSKYKDEIEQHYELGNNAFEKEDYKTSIKEYKKILIIEPNLTVVRNNLGLALAYNNQYDEALIQFKKLLAINPKSATVYTNIAYVYKKKLDYDNAEKALLKAHELDCINDNIVLELLSVYIDKKEYDKSIIFLRRCLRKNKYDIFQGLKYYLNMIQIYIYSNNIDDLEKVVDEIEEKVADEIEEKISEEKKIREYVSWELGNLAYKLYEAKRYELSEKISKRALKIDYSNDNIKKLYKESIKWRKTLELYNKLLNDERIIAPLKGPIVYYLFGDTYDEDEANEKYNRNIEAIESYINAEFDNVIKCIHILKSEYYILYNYREEMYKEIYLRSLENKKIHDKYIELKKDGFINNSILRLVSLLLCENLSQEEKKYYIKDIMNELHNESYNSIIDSINRLKNNYIILYNLNSKIFDDLIILASENNIKSNISKNNISNKTNNASNYKSNNEQLGCIISKNNISNKTNNTSNYKSNNEQLGCIVMIICALIGGAIGNIPGFIIGAIIGSKIIDNK